MDSRIKAIAVNYGLRHQMLKLGEELTELGLALLDHLKKPTVKSRGNVVEEMEDCRIIFDQLEVLMDITPEEKDLYRDFKLERQVRRMEIENESKEAANDERLVSA